MQLCFRNPANGYVEKVYGMWSFLWAFLFGPLYFLYKGAWPAALVLLAVCLYFLPRADVIDFAIALFVQLGFAMASQSIVKRTYLRKGWIEADPNAPAAAPGQPRAEPAFWSNDRRV